RDAPRRGSPRSGVGPPLGIREPVAPRRPPRPWRARRRWRESLTRLDFLCVVGRWLLFGGQEGLGLGEEGVDRVGDRQLTVADLLVDLGELDLDRARRRRRRRRRRGQVLLAGGVVVEPRLGTRVDRDVLAAVAGGR